MVSIVGYHTCSNNGGWSYIRTEAPFLSNDDHRQWLGQGYYFWTDSDTFAHRWGVDGYQGNYAITKCKIDIDEHLLLDLVGKVNHQEYFEKLMNAYRNRIKKAKQRNGIINPIITIPDVVKSVRVDAAKKTVKFPYLAIKIQDKSGKKTHPFSERKNSDVMPAKTRQQMCVFKSGFACIVEKKLVYPEDFASRSAKVICR